jgi:hypothetical protein
VSHGGGIDQLQAIAERHPMFEVFEIAPDGHLVPLRPTATSVAVGAVAAVAAAATMLVRRHRPSPTAPHTDRGATPAADP